MERGPRYSEADARAAVAASSSYAETLRRLGMCASGGNWRTLRRYLDEVWRIPTDHFDPSRARREAIGHEPRPLEHILVAGSSYSRRMLKRRLFASGLKQRVCEMCGQGELWQGRVMALILDHINGIADDNRLENLRILCPNCAATLDTHCGRKNRLPDRRLDCVRCGRPFVPRNLGQRYCSAECGRRWDRSGRPNHKLRRVERPPYDQLLREVRERGYCAVGRAYGVSDNAVRKWVRYYESERARGPSQATSEPADCEPVPD